jgi:tetratricopeptide (TPR) repeat protein
VSAAPGSERGEPDPGPADAAEWLDAVREAERRGELLLAVDLAERGLREHPDDPWLCHRAVLCLARSGSTDEARRRFDLSGLAEFDDEDTAALGARIAKARAVAASGRERRERAASAAAGYHAVFSRTGGYYPAVNAGTLSLLAGDRDAARTLAAQALELVGRDDRGNYYAAATEAEALLLLGDEVAAAAALERAALAAEGDHGALATTRRQLRTICAETGTDPAILDVLSGPSVAHYCGHRIEASDAAPRFRPEEVPAARERIAEAVERDTPAYAYGSLAGGADILWAEALLERGCELHVVLPFDHDEFVRRSVAPSGSGWVDRFHRCIGAARDVRYATDDAFLDDDVLYRYGSELAMGMALLHAEHLDTRARQFALWDGGPALGDAGTAIDVETWARGGRDATVVAVGDPERAGPPAEEGSRSHRIVRALVFADVKGFSKLSDEQMPRFSEHVLGALARSIEPHAERVEHRNTWGDAVFLVCDGVGDAAACALDLQAAMDAIDLQRHGLPDHLALRLGCHVGPVFRTWDPVLDEVGFMGTHVSRTARIEPVTPPGVVYVTEPFAAALALEGSGEFLCDYVGHMPAAKDFGRLRMHRLHRAMAE